MFHPGPNVPGESVPPRLSRSILRDTLPSVSCATINGALRLVQERVAHRHHDRPSLPLSLNATGTPTMTHLIQSATDGGMFTQLLMWTIRCHLRSPTAARRVYVALNPATTGCSCVSVCHHGSDPIKADTARDRQPCHTLLGHTMQPDTMAHSDVTYWRWQTWKDM